MVHDQFVEVRHPVAVLDEHWMVHPETGKPFYLSEKELREIAANMNKRLYQTGDESPIVIGHTQDGKPEHEQPEVIGYAKEWFVAPFFRTGKKALFSRWRVYRDKVPLLRRFPRRSVELWLDRWEVDPISLLGATTPDRDLGPVRLAAPKNKTVQVLSPEGDMENDDLVQKVIAALQQMPEFQFLKQLMSEAQGMQSEGMPQEGSEEMPPQEPAAEPGAEEEPIQHDRGDGGSWSEGPEGHYGGEGSIVQPSSEYGPDIYEGMSSREISSPQVKKAAGMAAAPSGTNTFTPGSNSIGKRKPKQLARDPQVNRVLCEMANEIEASRAEAGRLRAKFARAERGRELMEIAAHEGIDLDVEDELNFVAPENAPPMPDNLYRAHIDRIRKKYQRAPVGQRFIPTVSGSGLRPMSKERAMRAAELSLARGISYEQALEQAE